MTLGIVLLWGPRMVRFAMSEVPMHRGLGGGAYVATVFVEIKASRSS